MMKTKQELKQTITNFKPTKEQINYTEIVFLSMAKVETIKPIVRKIQTEVLKKYQFKIGDFNLKRFKEENINPVVLTENRTYLLKDSDFKIYLKECYKGYVDKGLNIEGDKLYIKNKPTQKDLNIFDYCPLLIAQDDLIKSQTLLINSFESVTGIKKEDLFTNFPKNLNAYIDLTLKFMVKFVRPTNEILKGVC